MLDLGDVLYAPTTFRDGTGRLLMVAWLQELRKGGGFDYAGCLSVPRLLTLQGESCWILWCLAYFDTQLLDWIKFSKDHAPMKAPRRRCRRSWQADAGSAC